MANKKVLIERTRSYFKQTTIEVEVPANIPEDKILQWAYENAPDMEDKLEGGLEQASLRFSDDEDNLIDNNQNSTSL